jgi:hypothetical protein
MCLFLTPSGSLLFSSTGLLLLTGSGGLLLLRERGCLMLPSLRKTVGLCKSAGGLLSSTLILWLAKGTKSSGLLGLSKLGLLLWQRLDSKVFLVPGLVLLWLSKLLLLWLSECVTQTRKGNWKSCRGKSNRSRPHHIGLALGKPKVCLLNRNELKIEHNHGTIMGNHEVPQKR